MECRGGRGGAGEDEREIGLADELLGTLEGLGSPIVGGGGGGKAEWAGAETG